jgi:hypothetical protein
MPYHKLSRNGATKDVIYDAEEAEFLKAIADFQKATGKKFPTFTEVLGVAKSIGWSKNQPSAVA